MDVISLSKASKALRDIQKLDKQTVAPGAESHFLNVDARIDWMESQAAVSKMTRLIDIILSQGTFDKTEYADGKIQLAKLLDSSYMLSGTWESPVIDLSEGWMKTNLISSITHSSPEAFSDNLCIDGKPISSPPLSASELQYLTDKNRSTKWRSSTYTNVLENIGYVGYDFGAGKEKHIRRMVLVQDSNFRALRVTPQYSDDGVAWVKAGEPFLNGLYPDYQNTTIDLPENGPHRFWRLLVTSNSTTGQVWAIYEMEMMEKSVPSKIELKVATSTDGLTFNSYTSFDPTAISQARYVRFKAYLEGTPSTASTKSIEMNDESLVMGKNAYVKNDGDLSLIRSYTFRSSVVNQNAEGTIHTTDLRQVDLKKINTIRLK